MKLFIKNMVCDRCIMAVENVLKELSLSAKSVKLGEVDFGHAFGEQDLAEVESQLRARLEELGFAFLNNKQSQMIEKIKLTCLDIINHTDGDNKVKLSHQIQESLNRDYHYLSNLFSSVEGITIEQYFIRQRIEKVKELLVYDELSLGEIAYQLGFSSVAHMSGQFKKVTGMTPSHFKSMKSVSDRSPLDKV